MSSTIWIESIKRCEDVRHAHFRQKTYARRSQTIEQVFAAAKEMHDLLEKWVY
jgi:hypothetical protein